MKLARGWPANKIRSGVFMEGTTTQNLLPHFHREHPQQVLLRKEETKKCKMPAKKEQKESVQKKHLMLLWRPRDYQWCPSFRPPRLPRGNKKMKMEASSDRGATRMKRTHVVHPPGTSPCMTLLDSCLHEENWSRHSCHRRWTACGSSWWNAGSLQSRRKECSVPFLPPTQDLSSFFPCIFSHVSCHSFCHPLPGGGAKNSCLFPQPEFLSPH